MLKFVKNLKNLINGIIKKIKRMMHKKENKNPLMWIAKTYREGVKKQDKKNTAEKFLKASEILFQEIKKEYTDRCSEELHISDVEYLDGYFIFGTGTNSVVHYHIDECPGWKFGTWFTEDEEYKHIIRYDWFAQYEENIDKFKPSASMISKSGRINIVNENICPWEEVGNIRFINQHPELAYYRDAHCCDFNLKYISEEEAIEQYNKDIAEKRASEEIKERARQAAVKWVEENIIPMDDTAKIIDKGDSWSPRYEVIINATKQELAPGTYRWDEDDDETLEAAFKELMEGFCSESEKACGYRDFYAQMFFHCCFEVVEEETYEKIQSAYPEKEKEDK